MRAQPSTAARVFNILEVQDDIEEALRVPPARHPPPVPVPLPSYLEHRDGADEIGKLSAEAVGKAYELAAQEIEKMGDELKERTRLCEKMVAESNQALDLIKETAAQFRDAGKEIFLRIEDNAAMTKEVRELCTTLKAKIAGPST